MKNKILHLITLTIAALAFCFQAGAASKGVIPLPVQVISTQGSFAINAKTLIITDNEALGGYLAGYLNAWLGEPLRTTTCSAPKENYIALTIDPMLKSPDKAGLRMPSEGYTLRVTPQGAEITGVDYGGLFNGIETLLQLMPATVYKCERQSGKLTVNCLEINDWPRFMHRGMMLDCARTFVSVERVKRFIDRLAHHKINRFHWHLTDDEGWRIEIKRYPELAQKAGFRGAGLPVKASYGLWEEVYGGYYTQEEIRDVVAYAALRNIEIIPEVELPGHSRAFARIHPEILCPGTPDTTAAGFDRRNVWCATREANYQMLSEILGEICALFPSQYIHVGGDEVLKGQWTGCPACSKIARKDDIQPVLDHFVGRITEILAANGKKPAAWDEACAGGSLDKNALVYGWQSVKTNLEATAKGYKTVFLPGSYCYFDMKQSPWEPGMTWAGLVDIQRVYSIDFSALGFSSQQIDHIAGVEGAFFSELLLSNEMDNPAYLDYQCYPRICALAEVAWTPQQMRNLDDFQDRLYGKHADRLSALGILFRIPPPDALYADGEITAVAHQRHEGIYYTYAETGRRAGLHREEYCCPMRVEHIERYRFMDLLNGRQSAGVPVTIRHSALAEPSSPVTVEFPIPEKEGTWLLRVMASEPDATIRSLRVVAPDTSYYIIKSGQRVNPLHQMRFTATDKTRGGKMIVTVQNGCVLPSQLSFQFERSPYVEPAVSVSAGTMGENAKFPLSNLTDYNFTSYARTARTCRKGDAITFTFDEPVECQSIDVRTGLFYLPRYHIPAGYVEISDNGTDFIAVAQLAAGRALITPAFSVKAVRIVSTADGNGDDAVAIQDLKIVPRFK